MNITDDTLVRDLPLRSGIKDALCHGFSSKAPELAGFEYYDYDRTFGQAKLIPDELLLGLHQFGPKSLADWVDLRNEVLGLPRTTTSRAPRRVRLHSMLLEHESAVIALYDIQRADADPDDFQDIQYDATVAKRRETVARIREAILNQMRGEA